MHHLDPKLGHIGFQIKSATLQVIPGRKAKSHHDSGAFETLRVLNSNNGNTILFLGTNNQLCEYKVQCK